MTWTGQIVVLGAVAVVVASARVAAAQGLYWESTTTGVGKQPKTTQTYAMPKMMKIVSAHSIILLRGDQDKFVIADTKNQTYRELTFTEMESATKFMQEQMAAARAEMEKQMKDMSPEQRESMEKMLSKIPAAGAAKPSAVVVKNTGETKTIGGYNCTKYVATGDGKTISVLWTTQDVKGFEQLRDDWVALQKRMAATDLGDAYSKIDGFPMATEIGDVKTVVTKVERRTIAASEFDVPAGYKKEAVDLPKLGKP